MVTWRALVKGERLVLVRELLLRVDREHPVSTGARAVGRRGHVVSQRGALRFDRVDLFDRALRDSIRREPVITGRFGALKRAGNGVNDLARVRGAQGNGLPESHPKRGGASPAAP